MDNRRRPNSRESERPPYARSAPYAPVEPVAEVVELGPVPRPKRGGLMPAALGLTVFAFGVLAGSSLVRLVPADDALSTTGPTSGTNVAIGSPVASSGDAPTPATPGAASTVRTTPTQTPAPTNVPWAWTQGTFDTSGIGAPIGLWSAGGNVVAAVGGEGITEFRVSDDGLNWATNRTSPAIDGYLASTVVDGRLWFVLRVVGLQTSHVEIAYPEWAEDGGNVRWVTQGPIAGSAPDWVGALAKVGRTWVMTPGHYVGEGGTQELWVSDDAVHWSTVRPGDAESVAISHIERMGSELVALGQLQTADYAPVALRSTDGRHWTSKAFPGPVGGGTSLYRMACSESACVAVGTTSTIGVERPMIWRTTDGLEWQVVGTDVTDARQDGYLSVVVATSSGFIVLGAPDQEVLVSRDGETWQSVSVLRRQDTGTIWQLTVNGDLAFALGDQPTAGTAAQWIGDVGELPFP